MSHSHLSAPGASALPLTGYVRQKPLLDVLPISGASLWRWVNAGTFPKPLKLSERVTAWDVAEVREWMRERAQGVPAAGAKRHETAQA